VYRNVTNVYTALIAVRVGRIFNAKLPSRIEVTVTHNSAEIRPSLFNGAVTPTKSVEGEISPKFAECERIKIANKNALDYAENVRVERVLFRGQA
jgi:hypothetical protein